MKFITAITVAFAAVATAYETPAAPQFGAKVPWERLDIDNAVLLILDLQVGLFQLARDFDSTLYYHNMMAHAALGKIFDIPVVMTTSAQQGPNGPLPKEILEMYPDAPLIQRNGQVSAWDNEEFRDAIKATNRTQIIVGGIVTDVCKSNFRSSSLKAQLGVQGLGGKTLTTRRHHFLVSCFARGRILRLGQR